MKKKKVVFSVVLAVLLTGIIVGVVVYVNKQPKESKWNVRIWVEDASKSGLILYMERNDEKGEDTELVLDTPFKVERWTAFGWQTVNMKENIRFGTDGNLLLVEKTYSSANRVEFDFYYEYLPMGMYRISRSVSARWDPANSETYYAPFVLASWWEILLVAIFIVILISVIWHHNGVFDKIKVKLVKWKFASIKKPFVVGVIIAVFGIGAIWGVFDYFAADITNAMHGLEVSAEEASDIYVKGTIVYGDGKYRLARPNKFTIEKKEGLGWRNVTPLYPEKMSEEPVSTMSMNVRINWSSYYGHLPQGTYRIKQAFEIRDTETRGEPVLEKGYYYITFTRD